MTAPLSPGPTRGLTNSHREILELLVRYRYLTPRLLSVAYGHGDREGRGLKHVRHELRRLLLGEYVTRFNPVRQLVGFANHELVYTATLKGARAVLSDEEYSRQRHRVFNRSRREQTNYEHHLGVSALHLILALGGPSQGFELFHFAGERDGAAVRIPVERPDGRLGAMYPDATAVFRFPRTEQRTLYLFEYDLARKNEDRLARRFRAYQDHLTRRLEELRRAHQVNNAVAVFIAPNTDAVVGLMRLAQAVLERSRRARPLFLFWNAEDWWQEIELERRQSRLHATKRKWTVRVLRDPAQILAEESLGSLDVPARRLVQSTVEVGGRVLR
jgi:hypothetical protein